MGYDHIKDNNAARTIRHTAHTDLALELQEELESDGMRGQREQRDSRSFGSGIHVEKRKREGGRLKEAIITVTNGEGERILGKPKGVYITLEGVDLASGRICIFRENAGFHGYRSGGHGPNRHGDRGGSEGGH